MGRNNDSPKAQARNRIRAFRARISQKEKEAWDQELCRRFFAALDEKQIKISSNSPVYLYMDFRGEAGTGRILDQLWSLGIPTALPRTEGTELVFYEINAIDQLSDGYMGIREPKQGLHPADDQRALVLVPGVAFDRSGFRLGYGKGFYDRFFAREPEHLKWGLAYEFQLMDTVPHDRWDQKVDLVITQKQWYQPNT